MRLAKEAVENKKEGYRPMNASTITDDSGFTKNPIK